MRSLLEEIMGESSVSGEKLGLCLILNDIAAYDKQKDSPAAGDEEDTISQEVLDELISRISTVEEAEKI